MDKGRDVSMLFARMKQRKMQWFLSGIKLQGSSIQWHHYMALELLLRSWEILSSVKYGLM